MTNKYTTFSAFALCFIATNAAYAQASSMAGRESELSVLTRTTPLYDPIGVHFKGLKLNASIENSLEYQDNLYSTQTNHTEDVLYKLRPEIQLSSNIARHQLTTRLSAEVNRYKNTPDENHINIDADISGRVDVSRRVQIPLSFKYSKQHSERSDPDNEGGELKPTESNQISISGGFRYRGANLNLIVGSTFRYISFKDNKTDSTVINNDDRDKNEYSMYANLGLTQGRLISPFVYTSYKNNAYKQRIDDNGQERSSSVFIAGLGLNLSPQSHLFSSIIRIGYTNSSFDDNQFLGVSGLTYSANFKWEPSTLLALNLLGTRNLNATTQTDYSSTIDTQLSLGASYEITPNIFLNPNIIYLEKEYQGNIDRDINRLSADLEIIYKINRNHWVYGQYSYIKQMELIDNIEQSSFKNNSYVFSSKLQF